MLHNFSRTRSQRVHQEDGRVTEFLERITSPKNKKNTSPNSELFAAVIVGPSDSGKTNLIRAIMVAIDSFPNPLSLKYNEHKSGINMTFDLCRSLANKNGMDDRSLLIQWIVARFFYYYGISDMYQGYHQRLEV